MPKIRTHGRSARCGEIPPAPCCRDHTSTLLCVPRMALARPPGSFREEILLVAFDHTRALALRHARLNLKDVGIALTVDAKVTDEDQFPGRVFNTSERHNVEALALQ